ncbi:MAG: hypothetical protein IPJ30_14295 [Acidobacteria bacterium]|nr:hypothetical protein [Acidobacteriota bacterium]
MPSSLTLIPPFAVRPRTSPARSGSVMPPFLASNSMLPSSTIEIPPFIVVSFRFVLRGTKIS